MPPLDETPRATESSIHIRAHPAAVWATLVEPDRIVRWMAGARVETTWEPGSPIAITVILNGCTYRDRGTVLVFEKERLLRYDQWNAVSRRPDAPENRTVVTHTLMPDAQGTLLHVRHENLTAEASFEHARFFWRGALSAVKAIAEVP